VTAPAAAVSLAVPAGPAAGLAAGDLAYLFADPACASGLGAGPRRLAGLLDAGFLAGAGWDPARLILEVPAGHRLLGWQQCRVAGCISRGDGPEQVCLGCRLRLAANGLRLDELDLMPARGWQRPEQCRVAGCPRTWRTPRLPLCRAHLHQQREVLKIGLEEFLTHPGVRPLPPCGPCQVTACVRGRDGAGGAYCGAHVDRWAKARKADPGLDEQQWRATTAAIARPGLVSLRGLPPGLITEILFGLQQRCAAERRTSHKMLRTICDDMRRQQVATIADFAPGNVQRPVVGSFLMHLRRAAATTETEKADDVWDLALFGHGGRMSFTAITQGWLRETAKRWVLEELPRRRGRRVGDTVQAYVNSVARLSESLRARPDGGRVPAALGRGDVENFLNRLAFQQSAGQVSLRLRERICRDLRQVFEYVRALGLTRPGQPAAGLSDDFALLAGDVPHPPQPGEPSRDLPAEIIAQLCGHLDKLEVISSPRMRTAVELLIDTGRRPGEICTLGFGCLDRDSDAAPVLVYDNHKAARLGRRLPVSQATARLITDQQAWTRARFPHTPAAELKLLPTSFANPGGRKGIRTESLSERHRTWVDALPPLLRADGSEYDKAKITLYAYRHTYAQRHADAGIPADVLRELMDHRLLDATRQYYRVGETRRRQAVDRVAVMQFDRHGNRTWQQAKALLDSEHVRRAVGEVAVPFGVCAEPSNVKAGGQSCPFRFRCAGCDHFRTDVSYLPDLQAYLDDLLRSKERLLAASELDEWAKADALPSEEEIIRIRRLITRINVGLGELTAAERDQIDQAIAVVRRHRAVMLGMPRIRQALPSLRPGRTA
jgi:integrase